ncbi:MAG: type II toxin-antitoxin system HipA family toxin [Syntrophorhabdaceae bacterium]|nr:type II toxin-antitoxin system HipA family toxin [Syntrophorhabdaceae bacterium]
MHRPVRAIEVRVWGKRAGALAVDPRLGYYAFEYDPAFAAAGIELAPLTMPLANARAPFVFTDLPELTFKRLPGMIADALPDDFGNALIDAWMAGKGIDRLDITALDRLAYMGRRGTGALEFRPVIGPEVKRSTAIKLSRLVESARRAVQGDIGSDNTAKAALQQIIQVGTSAGGARAKAAIAWNPKTDEIRSGQFDVEPGFEHWILKFDGVGADRELGGSRNYGRIEYAYYLMARRAGISISPCRLMEENGRAHFMTRRFDRDGNARHHMQTLCAMKHLDFKQKATHDYSQFFMAIEQLQLGHAALEEAFRRVAFNVMAANCDDHTKNFSFILRQGGSWELAPAYDITHAYNPKGEWTYQHLMAVNGKFSDIRLEDFLLVAERFMIGNPKKILGQVQEAVEAWPEFAAEAGISEGDIGRVHGHHQPLLSAKIL